jgi:hypothetical protein
MAWVVLFKGGDYLLVDDALSRVIPLNVVTILRKKI